jgi:hypothetical protein
MDNDLQSQINKLQKDLNDLNDEIYLNNFTGHQDFNKYINFTSRLKVPHYTALPATCDVGEIIEYNGKLYIASALNTWTIVGTQS